MKQIFQNIDRHGVPFSFLSKIEVIYTPNIYEEEYITTEIEHNLNQPKRAIKFYSPINEEQELDEQIVLDYIEETTGLKINSAVDLTNLPTLHGNPFLLVLNEHSNKKKLSLAREILPGSLIVRDSKTNWGLSTLGRIKTIKGDFGICDSSLSDLGLLNEVHGNVWIKNYDNISPLTSLQNIEQIRGDLTISSIGFKSLGLLKKIKGNLNLRKSSIYDLGMVEEIQGNFYGLRSVFSDYNFSKVKIQGKIKLYKN